jgi:FkbM family methyltransferase
MPPLVAQRLRDWIYPRSTARVEGYRFTVRSQTGSPFTGTTSDHVAYPMAVHGYFNWRNIAIARAVCGEGDVIVEIGANVGSETVGFSDIVGATGVVHAFEPYPPNLVELRVNAEQARYRNINVWALALSDGEGNVQFADPRPGNSGSGHLLGVANDQMSASPATEVTEVRCTTLDSLMLQLGRPRLVVVDAEGHDAAVLRGAERLLTAYQPVIVLEVVEELLARSGSTPSEVASHLSRLGYNVVEITRFGLAAVDIGPGTGPVASDWIAVPRGSDHLTVHLRRTLRRCGATPLFSGVNPLRR